MILSTVINNIELKLVKNTQMNTRCSIMLILFVGIYFRGTTRLGNLFLKRRASSKHPKIKPFKNNQLYGIILLHNHITTHKRSKHLMVGGPVNE